jgi:hypothetical protein
MNGNSLGRSEPLRTLKVYGCTQKMKSRRDRKQADEGALSFIFSLKKF